MSTNSLFFFWIAEFSDSTAISQFDPETGIENPGDSSWLPSKENSNPIVNKRGNFAEKNIIRFGWYPFSFDFAQKVYRATGILAVPSERVPHIIDIKPSERLVAYRSVISKQFKFHKCLKCNHLWQFTEAPIDPLINLPTSSKKFVEKIEINTQQGPKTIAYLSSICPGCGYHDCNEIMIKDKKIKVLSDRIFQIIYVLGRKGEKLLTIREGGETIA